MRNILPRSVNFEGPSTTNTNPNRPNEEDKARIREILTNPANRKFLLDTFAKQRDLEHNRPEIRLQSKDFALLVEILNEVVSGNPKDLITGLTSI